MERQEKGNMEIFGSSIGHRNDVPKTQSSSETNSFNINPTSSARTLQQTQAEADNATSRQPEVFYEGSETNKGEKEDSFDRYWKHVPLPTKAKTNSDGEIGISISSHPTKADSATLQQTKQVKFLEFVKKFCEYLPEVSKPDRKIELNEKVLLTVIVVFIFMVLCQIPLFGIQSSESVDRFYHMRITRASHRGTPMEFGMVAFAESHLTLLILTGFKIIDVHDTPYDHALLNGAHKLLALLLTVVYSVLYIMTGMYGVYEQIGVTFSILISMQLIMAGLIILLLNELVRKGYCLGTEISLFIVANICGTIMWKAFSPLPVNTDQDSLFYEIRNSLATIFVFLTVIYLKGFRVKLRMKSTMRRGDQSFYPINLLYTSVAPTHLQSTFVPIFNLFSQVLSAKFHENGFINLLGVWADVKDDGLPRSYPIGGLCYYLSPPRNPLQVTQDPVYAAVYTVFMIGSCALYSRIWINFINKSAVDVSKELRDKNMVMFGYREQSMLLELERYITTAAVLGGLCIGTLSVLADFFGVFGSGTGVILVAVVLYEYAELFFKEQNVQNQQIILLF